MNQKESEVESGMNRWMKVLTTALAAGLLASCGGGVAVPTCAEYAEMGPETGLFVEATAEQQRVLTELLSDRGYSDDSLNVAMAHTQIIAYCNIYDGASGGKGDLLIDGIPGLEG